MNKLQLILLFALVVPSKHCELMMHTATWLGVIAMVLSTLPFLFRVYGVYYDSLTAKVFFSCIWLLAVAIFPVVEIHHTAPATVPPDYVCSSHSVNKFTFIALLPMVIFDLVVFIAISFRVVKVYTPHTHRRRIWRTFVTGEGIGTIPKALLRTGQFYFL